MSQASRVLIVEDDADLRQVAVEMLSLAGYDVVEAPDADEALRLVTERAVRVVITDIRMPGSVDGWGLARKLKAMVPPLKVICVTGYARHEEGRVNCDAFLRKPFKFSELFRALDLLLAT